MPPAYVFDVNECGPHIFAYAPRGSGATRAGAG
jgi:hypothetical protein